MDKKQIIIRISSVVAFVLVLLLVLNHVYDVVSWKDTEGNYLSTTQELYATPKDTMELVFVGSSHCYGGIDPNYFWTEYGIPAFDMCCSGQDKDSAYYQLKELLKTQSPKVVAVEAYAFLFERQEMVGNAYRNMLSLKFSPNANKLIKAYVEEEDQEDYLLRWPIVHTRYQELTKYDFYQYQPSVFCRGFNYNFYTQPIGLNPESPYYSEVTEISEHNKQWIDDLKKLSEEEGFELMFIEVTSDVSNDEQAIMNGVEQYLNEQGIVYMDLNKAAGAMGIDQNTDFIDYNHLNYYGAQKATAYIASYLLENYDLEAHDGDKGYELWDQNAEYAYHKVWADNLGRTDREEYISTITNTRDVIAVLSLDGYFGITGSDWAQVLGSYGLTENPEQIYDGGTWVIRNGKVISYMTNSIDEPMFAWDLNDTDTLVIKNIDDYGTPRTDININAKTSCQNTDGLNVLVYDEVLGEIVNTRHYD